MKVTFRDELRICIGQDDETGTFAWWYLDETYNDDYLKKISKLWSFMSVKESGKIAIITSTISAYVWNTGYYSHSINKKLVWWWWNNFSVKQCILSQSKGD